MTSSFSWEDQVCGHTVTDIMKENAAYNNTVGPEVVTLVR
jgi:hypothetical protein